MGKIMFKKQIGSLLISSFFLLAGCDAINFIDDINSQNDGGRESYESIQISQEKAVENLEKLGLEEGYEIIYEYKDDTSSGKYLVGRKGNTIWLKTSESEDGVYTDGYAFVKDGNKYHSYSFENEEGYVYTCTYEDEETVSSIESSYAVGYNYWLYFGYTYDGLYKKDGTATVVGRKCDKYVYQLNSLIAQVNMKYVVYVDQKLGITLRLDFEASADGQNGNLNFEVKQFNTGSAVSMPTLPEPTITQEVE